MSIVLLFHALQALNCSLVYVGRPWDKGIFDYECLFLFSALL